MVQVAQAVRSALDEAGLNSPILRTRDLSGGCIHQVMNIALEDGTSVVAKVARAEQVMLFEEEAEGLRALAATETVIVPRPLATVTASGAAVLVMQSIPHAAPTEHGWRQLGEELAALHRFETSRFGQGYGFHMDNHCGTTPQPNDWRESWVQFNREHRLGHQVSLAEQAGVLRDEERRRLRRLIDQLDRFIPDRPKPALLHGDLWAGNALPTVDGDGESRVAVIDPATSIGDGWADIAMMKLFGGFSPGCFEAYAANVDDHDQVESRIAVYQLYHLLNHVNLFGRGYIGQVMAIVDRLS